MSVMMGLPITDGTHEHPAPVVLLFISGGFRVNVQICVNGTPKMNRSSPARIGYARVSTADQNLDAQIAALRDRTAAPWSAPRLGTAPPSRDVPNCGPSSISSIPARRWWSRASTAWRARCVTSRSSSRNPQGQGRPPRCHRTARGHLDRGRQGVLRHARRLCRVRDQPASRALGRGDRRGEATRRLPWPPTQDRHGSHQTPAGRRPVADRNRPRAVGLTRHRLQGQGGHDGQRVTRPAKSTFAPENAVIHRGVLFKMSIHARSGRLGLIAGCDISSSSCLGIALLPALAPP